MKSNQLNILISRRFFPLFLTQFLGAFNDNVFKNALVILITYQIGSAANINPQVLVTVAAGIFILPFFLFSASAGQLADKYEKTRLIRIVKMVEIFLMILATMAFHLKNIPMLLSLLFLLGVQATFFGPLKYSILPTLLQPSELIAGNGLVEAGTFVAILLGTILGGVLVLVPHGEYFISLAICIFAILGYIASLYLPLTHMQNLSLVINYNFLTETMCVIRYSRERSDIFAAIIGISWFWLVGAVYLAEFPVFAKDILHADQYVVTMFIVIFTIGIAIGSLLCNLLLKGKIETKYIALSALGMTIFPVDLYLATHQINIASLDQLIDPLQFLSMQHGWRIMLDLLLIAICGGLYTVPLYAILQQRSDESHRARVIASNNVVNSLFMVLSSIIVVIMLKLHFTVSDIFLAVAGLNILIPIYIRYKLS